MQRITPGVVGAAFGLAGLVLLGAGLLRTSTGHADETTHPYRVVVASLGSDGPLPVPPTPIPPTPVPPTPVPPLVEQVLSPAEEAAVCVRLPLPAGYVAGTVPPWAPGTSYAGLVADRLALYRSMRIDYTTGYKDYSSTGDYLNYGELNKYELDPAVLTDSRGVPMVAHDGVYYYNPSTVAQYALTMHGRAVRGMVSVERFLEAADALIELQRADGAFPYPFAFPYYRTGEILPVGWASALSQGQALSVFRRAYDASGDPRYAAAGDAALDFLLRHARDGGSRASLYQLDPSLNRLVFFQEYPTAVPQYTLNGFLFVLLGLYDWSNAVSPKAGLAEEFFECGLASVVYSLPYYDPGGFSAYDLGNLVTGGEPNLQVERHAIHIQLLNALNSVAPHQALVDWRDRWIAQVADQD